MDSLLRMIQRKGQGFHCTQIILLMGLDDLGRENTDLVRAAHGLTNGLMVNEEVCGALLGGIALLGLHAGKGLPEEPEDPRIHIMTADLIDWFTERTSAYGSIRCHDLLAKDPARPPCGELIMDVYAKVNELLAENGFEVGR